MATRNGAAGPSNLKSRENLILVWAAAGPASRIVATVVAASSPARPSLSLFSMFATSWIVSGAAVQLLLSKEHAE